MDERSRWVDSLPGEARIEILSYLNSVDRKVLSKVSTSSRDLVYAIRKHHEFTGPLANLLEYIHRHPTMTKYITWHTTLKKDPDWDIPIGLVLYGLVYSIPRVARSDETTMYDRLELRNKPTPTLFKCITRFAELRTLRIEGLWYTKVVPTENQFGELPYLSKLKKLVMSDCFISPSGFMLLFRYASNLEELHWDDYVYLSKGGMEMPLPPITFPKLKRFSGTDISFFILDMMPNLEWLNAGRQRSYDIFWARLRATPRLKFLAIDLYVYGDDMERSLPTLPELEELDITTLPSFTETNFRNLFRSCPLLKTLTWTPMYIPNNLGLYPQSDLSSYTDAIVGALDEATNLKLIIVPRRSEVSLSLELAMRLHDTFPGISVHSLDPRN